jgi:hypothetical protein
MLVHELKQLQAEKEAEFLVIRGLVAKSETGTTDEQRTEMQAITRSLENIKADITLAEQELAISRNIPTVVAPQPVEKTEMNSLQAIRALSTSGLTPDLAARNKELAEGVISQGVFAKRNYSYGTNGADISPSMVQGLNILEGRTDIYRQCGATIYPDLKGSTQRLPFMDAFAGQVVAEKGTITRDQTSPSSVELVPQRVGIQIEVTREGLDTFNQTTWDGILANAGKAIDRKLSAMTYTAILAGATAVATGAITKVGFDALEASVPVDGVYFMARKTFYEAKGVPIDAGSGKFLAQRNGQDIGETYEGVPIFHSGLFADGAAQQYVTYGVPSNIAIGFWGNDAYELIVDPFTKAADGTLVVTISRIADIKIPNVARAFSKSPDLDVA